jgi:hypothetical protein
MKTKIIVAIAMIFFPGAVGSLSAQELGPQFKKVSRDLRVCCCAE